MIETFREEQRARRSPVFDAQLRERLRAAELDDHALMRERAATEVAKARAEVLLNSRSFYPDLACADEPVPMESSASAELSDLSTDPVEKIDTRGRELPVNNLVEVCRSYLKGREREIEKRTRRDIEVVVATFADILACFFRECFRRRLFAFGRKPPISERR